MQQSMFKVKSRGLESKQFMFGLMSRSVLQLRLTYGRLVTPRRMTR